MLVLLNELLSYRFRSRDCGFAVVAASIHIFQDGCQTEDPCGDSHIYDYLQQATQQQQQLLAGGITAVHYTEGNSWAINETVSL